LADVHVNTLRRAAEIAGGVEQLAVILNVTPSHLVLWIKGVTPPPSDIFLRAVDLVVETEILSQTQPGLHPAKL
jgi:DNA-binding transcriptional regulator YdaS (Cro superfamily)